MPPVRSIPVRRSRRLAMQVPVKYDDDGWQSGDVTMGLVAPLLDAAATGSPSSPPKAPRPPNAFLQFRSTYWEENKRERNNRNVSRICGFLWNSMSAEERRVYEEMAAVAQAEHKLKYPHFTYAPGRREKKPKTHRNRDCKEEDRCRKIALLFRKGVKDIEITMEVKTEEPVDAIPSPTPSVEATEERAPSLSHSATPPVKTEEEEKSFVPTSAIPPLDLSASAAEKEDAFPFDGSVQPPSYIRVDAQFGMNPDVNMDSNSIAPPADDTARPELFDPVENYMSDYVNMLEVLDGVTDIAPPEAESLFVSADWAYI